MHPISLGSMLLLSHHTAAVSNSLHKNLYWNMWNCKYNTYTCVISQNMFWLDWTYTWKLRSWSSLDLFIKLFYIVLLLFTSIILQYSSTVNAYPLRFLPDWNPVTEVMITICTTDIDTVHSPDTAHIQHLQTWRNKIIKKKVRIMDKSYIIIIIHNCQTYIWLNHYNM